MNPRTSVVREADLSCRGVFHYKRRIGQSLAQTCTERLAQHTKHGARWLVDIHDVILRVESAAATGVTRPFRTTPTPPSLFSSLVRLINRNTGNVALQLGNASLQQLEGMRCCLSSVTTSLTYPGSDVAPTSERLGDSGGLKVSTDSSRTTLSRRLPRSLQSCIGPM